jgi:hypothetical protein
MKLTPTKMETEIGKETESEVLLTKELNQLSFKDRNDYQGKCMINTFSTTI